MVAQYSVGLSRERGVSFQLVEVHPCVDSSALVERRLELRRLGTLVADSQENGARNPTRGDGLGEAGVGPWGGRDSLWKSRRSAVRISRSVTEGTAVEPSGGGSNPLRQQPQRIPDERGPAVRGGVRGSNPVGSRLESEREPGLLGCSDARNQDWNPKGLKYEAVPGWPMWSQPSGLFQSTSKRRNNVEEASRGNALASKPIPPLAGALDESHAAARLRVHVVPGPSTPSGPQFSPPCLRVVGGVFVHAPLFERNNTCRYLK